MNDLIRPALYQSYHEIVPVIKPSTLTPTLSLEGRSGREAPGEGESASLSHGKNKSGKIDIVGPVCESGDFFALGREMPELQRRRFARNHERRRVRICDGVELQFASTPGGSARSRRQIRADPEATNVGRPRARRSGCRLIGTDRRSLRENSARSAIRALPLAEFRTPHK